MICLNLGCGHAGEDMPGMVNLDRNPKYGDGSGWTFESGLPQYAECSVDGITISHAMMYVDMKDWQPFLREAWRVLKPNGVIRITEDVTDDPMSRHWYGHHPLHSSYKGRKVPVTLSLMVAKLAQAGFNSWAVREHETMFCDSRLRQNRHGGPPHVFFVEGVK